jgi:hypothetical protein
MKMFDFESYRVNLIVVILCVGVDLRRENIGNVVFASLEMLRESFGDRKIKEWVRVGTR